MAGVLDKVRRPVGDPDPAKQVADWFRALGVTVPPSEPVALRWTGDTAITIPASEAGDDDLVITPDTPDVDDLADQVVCMVRDADRRRPALWSWHRWPVVGRVAGWLYVTGITSGGGSYGSDDVGRLYTLPSWSSLLHRRCYLLGLPMWWWECQRRQGLTLRGRHRPAEPFAFGVCARCLPCHECGEAYECRDDCRMVAS